MRGQHTGASMARAVFKTLRTLKVSNKLLGFTRDNASNNSTLSQSLATLLEEDGYAWNPTECAVPCLAHIINLVVQDIITYLKLGSTDSDEEGKVFQRRHVQDIANLISVPNLLKKVSIYYYSY